MVTEIIPYRSMISQFPLLSAEQVASLLADGRQDKVIEGNLRLVVDIALRYERPGVSLDDLIQEGNLGLMQAVEEFEPERGCSLSTYATWWIKKRVMGFMLTQYASTPKIPVYRLNQLKQLRHYCATQYPGEDLFSCPVHEIAQGLEFSEETVRELLTIAQMTQVVSLEMPLSQEDDTTLGEVLEADAGVQPDRVYGIQEQEQVVERLLSALSRMEREVIERLLGLYDDEEWTVEALAHALHKNRSQVTIIRDRALLKLRRTAYIYRHELGDRAA